MWKWYFLAIYFVFELLHHRKDMQNLRAAAEASTVGSFTRSKRIATVLLAFAVIAVCTVPMGWAPLWSGKIPGPRNQYELCAEAFLKGQLHLELEVPKELLALENPYDPEARSGFYYRWDHAFYDGKYYMYFGVVPVLLVFLPFRAITGQSLNTYHCTQLFAAAYIIGVFALFGYVARKKFPKLPFSVYLLLAAALSIMSIWYCTAAPALYCTPISGALALMVWCLYLFCRAVFDGGSDRRTFTLAFFGSLCGALAFGCRPSIALGNLLVLPLLIYFLKQRKFSWKLLGQLIIAAAPYAFVAAGLMWYNWARFDDPFEFGQAYQLTVADQSGYSIASRFDLKLLRQSLANALFQATDGALNYGIFLNFPITLFGVWALCKRGSRAMLRRAGLGPMLPLAFAAVLLIISIDVLWSPYLLPRYTMDYLWIFGLAAFIGIGALYESSDAPRLTRSVCLLCAFTVLVCLCLFLTPYDGNFAEDRDLQLKWVENLLKW